MNSRWTPDLVLQQHQGSSEQPLRRWYIALGSLVLVGLGGLAHHSVLAQGMNAPGITDIASQALVELILPSRKPLPVEIGPGTRYRSANPMILDGAPVIDLPNGGRLRTRQARVTVIQSKGAEGLWQIRVQPLPTRPVPSAPPDLHGSNLCGVNLREASLSGADLHGANLAAADLRRANLQWADLRGANLQGTDLRGANLEEAELQDARITGALYDTATRWPVGFDPGRHGAKLAD